MKKRFFYRNLLLFTLPVLISISILGAFSLYMTYNNAKKNIMDVDKKMLTQIKESTEIIFNEADAQSLNYSVAPYAMLKLEALFKNEYIDKTYLDTSYIIKTFLDSSVNSKQYLHSIYIYFNNDRDNFFASGIGLANNKNFKDLDWLQRIKNDKSKNTHILEVRKVSEYAKSEYSTDVITLYKKLFRAENKEAIGYIAINIKTSYMKSFLTGFLTYKNQSITVLDENNQVLCHVGPKRNFDSMDSDAAKNSDFITTSFSDKYHVKYISITPRFILFENTRNLFVIVLLIIVVALLFGTAVTFAITRKNYNNINNIINLIDAAERGEPLPQIIYNGNNEYDYIVQNIVKTFLAQKYLNMQLSEKKYKLETMYFSLLQSQLNPHFMFNTLKNIFWKTVKITGKPNEASKMIDLLSNILYYALVNKEKYVTLEEEINKTKCYLKIQQMRFDYNFKIEWDYPEEILDKKCIKFLLQPLLENSVSHGVAKNDGNGFIKILIKRQENTLIFSVMDNGAGFESKRLKEINMRLKEEVSPAEGIGLYNVNKRLVLTYGEDSELNIESIPNHETTVSFKIPIITE